jgi:replicative superfamily II helicase
MSCKFNNSNGECELWNEDDDNVQFDHIVDSCDENGYCLVDEDESPEDGCEDYEER